MIYDFATSVFDFDLPPERIAQQAIEPRDHARLLHVTTHALADHHVYDLPDLLHAGDVLVINDTRVIPARLFGKRGDVRVEILLLKKITFSTWEAFARPGKRLKTGDKVIFADDFSAEIIEKRESGDVVIRFNVGDGELLPLLQQYGEPPLPPYIKREKAGAVAVAGSEPALVGKRTAERSRQIKSDTNRYQTIYAAQDGAVAAPTAGLHFTLELMEKLRARGIEFAKVTLHVGAGTFLPVKVDNIKDHVMHAEYGEISAATAAQLNKAKAESRRIIAVGTTSLRVLESATDERGVLHSFARETSIFIAPGYRFRFIDALMTNFHLPQSTLFMLVSAFMGLEIMRTAYDHAIQNDYRFYSYGDTSLLER